jgi:membrane protease YdiL (CAAX protease family)
MAETESQDVTEFYTAEIEIIRKKAYPDIKGTIILFFVTIGCLIVTEIPAVILMAIFETRFDNSHLLKPLLNLLTYITALSITIWYAVRKSKKQEGSFSGISVGKTPLWIAPAVMIGALALIILLDQSSSWIPMPVFIKKTFEDAFTKDIFSIISVVIFAPLMEEILCRGIVLKGLLKNYKPGNTIVISALFFAAIHLNPWQAIPAFFGGLFLGWVYYKTQSVVPCIVIHATINATLTAFLFLPGKPQGFLSMWGVPGYLVACSVSFVVFAAVCFIIQKKTQPSAG